MIQFVYINDSTIKFWDFASYHLYNLFIASSKHYINPLVPIQLAQYMEIWDTIQSISLIPEQPDSISWTSLPMRPTVPAPLTMLNSSVVLLDSTP